MLGCLLWLIVLSAIINNYPVQGLLALGPYTLWKLCTGMANLHKIVKKLDPNMDIDQKAKLILSVRYSSANLCPSKTKKSFLPF